MTELVTYNLNELTIIIMLLMGISFISGWIARYLQEKSR